MSPFGDGSSALDVGKIDIEFPLVTDPSGLLLCENFENTGGDGYDVSGWTETLGTNGVVDSDYATSPCPLRGGQSLRIYAGTSGSSYTYNIFSGSYYNELYAHMLFRSPDATPVANQSIFIIENDGGADLAYIQMISGGKLRAFAAGGTNADTPDGMYDNTTYRLWVHWKAENPESALNGTMKVQFTATSVKSPTWTGTNYAICSDGNQIGTSRRCCLIANSTNTIYIDQLYISNSAITDVPD